MVLTTDLTEYASVLYSQEVTEEIMANIETDLGVASFQGFIAEGPPYGVDALNQITSDLVTKGVLYIGSRCKVSISGSQIIVADGVCVFGDGSKVRIENSASVPFVSAYTNHVYFVKTSDNKVLLYNASSAIKTEYAAECYVKLAEVSSDKVVSDKRTYSQARYTNPGGMNLETTISVELTAPTGDDNLAETEGMFSGYTISTKEITLDYGGYNYLHAESDESDSFTVRIADGKVHEICDGPNYAAWVQKNGPELTFIAGTWGERVVHDITLSLTLH